MAGGLSNYMENALLNWFKGTAFPAVSANTYVALFTAAPTDAGGGTEVTGGGYARQAVASGGWSAISGSGPEQISNSATVNFGTATAGLGTIVAFAVYDAVTAGNLLFWATLTANATVNNGDSYSFAAGALVFSID